MPLTDACRRRLRDMQVQCQRAGEVEGVELKFRAKDDARRLRGQMNATALYDSAGNWAGWRASVLDVTRAKVLAQHVMQLQTLAAIEQLAGRAAHKFHDLLQIMQSYA
jgi:hypothetical protein